MAELERVLDGKPELSDVGQALVTGEKPMFRVEFREGKPWLRRTDTGRWIRRLAPDEYVTK